MVYFCENLFCNVIWHSCIQMLLPDFITRIYNVVHYLILIHINLLPPSFCIHAVFNLIFFFLKLNWELKLKITACISPHTGWRSIPNEMQVFCGRFLPSHSNEIQQILHITVPFCIAYGAIKDTAQTPMKDPKNQISVYITTGHFSCPCLIQGAFQNRCRDKHKQSRDLWTQ